MRVKTSRKTLCIWYLLQVVPWYWYNCIKSATVMQVCKCSYQRNVSTLTLPCSVHLNHVQNFCMPTFKNTVWATKTTLYAYRISCPSGACLVTHRDRPISLHRTVNIQLHGIHLQCRGSSREWLAYGASLTKWRETVVIAFDIYTCKIWGSHSHG
jgi:hypothetical protein